MAIVVMILGESGTGKSASLRNFKPDELAVVNVIGKPLPFRSKGFTTLNSDIYSDIRKFMNKTDRKSIVIDDAQYLMANEFMRRAREKGYEKFTEIGQNFWDLINYCRKLDDETIVYFLQHTETSSDGSTTKAKTIGKMLDEKVTLEGMFSIVLKTVVDDDGYHFSTRNSGQDTVKSPVGMFDTDLIPNDLKLVDDHIRDYYDLKPSGPVQVQEDPIEEPGGKYLDINAPHVGIVDDDTPLMGMTDYGRIKTVLNKKGIEDEELRGVVADKGIYPFETPISDYDPDFIDYLIENINKIYGAIVAKRDPLA